MENFKMKRFKRLVAMVMVVMFALSNVTPVWAEAAVGEPIESDVTVTELGNTDPYSKIIVGEKLTPEAPAAVWLPDRETGGTLLLAPGSGVGSPSIISATIPSTKGEGYDELLEKA